MKTALPEIGLTYPEHAQEGVFLWIDTGVDTNALALEAKNDGWLVAPGSLFSPKQGASNMMRFNVTRTTPEFMRWLGDYLEKHQ
jgi:DNA-binding transcriptional MocR family regulator